ncbi:timeless protein, putative [Ixodes scapularis]|uniref:Timeless protein, putative n=1 Tax=Ixodes scapularis TaxID=6945 RepID=B7PRZ4_IXOSC|nr:timeless protein, putative [Ixodes scapularis]|eukprot:XP_002401472.1 timeless protein, putative [Ixodes scapularis]
MRVFVLLFGQDQEPSELTENDLEGLSNCLVLLRNLLHVPDKSESAKFGISENTYDDWLSVHNKLIWNLFVHGLDGVLILMLNSEYKVNWAVVVVQIIALLYKDQDVGSLQHLISNSTSTSESSEDDIESNTSKHSMHHTSSNDSVQQQSLNKLVGGTAVNSSGPPSTAGDSGYCQSDFTSCSNNSRMSGRDKGDPTRELSTSSASADNLTSSSNGQSSSSDEDNQVKEHIKDPHHKASAKHRAMHSADSPSGSDSSNEDELLARSKQRSLVAMSRKSKSQLKGGKCTPSVCLEAAVSSLEFRSTLRDPVWDRKKTLVLLDVSAHVPSNDDIRDFQIEDGLPTDVLLDRRGGLVWTLVVVEEFEGRTKVNQDKGASLIDRCHFLWVVGYFTGLATALGLSFHHVKPVLSVEVVGLLVYEAIAVCNELDLDVHNSAESSKLLKKRYHLVVRAFRELIAAIGTYNSRCKGDDMRRICVSLAKLEDLRNIPLLLIRKWAAMPGQLLVDLIITNHLLLLILEYAQKTEGGLEIDILGHLTQFATTEVMEKYGEVLKDFRTNSMLVNDCVFTMMHHVAGDLKRPEALFHPSILSCFVNILNEGAEIPELYEDLVGYVMNRYLKLAGRNPELYAERMPVVHKGAPASSTQPLVFLLNSSKVKDHAESQEVVNEEISEITDLVLKLKGLGFESQLQWIQKKFLEVCYVKLKSNRPLVDAEPVALHYTLLGQSVPIVAFSEIQSTALKNLDFFQLLQKLGLHVPKPGQCPYIPCSWEPDKLYATARKLGPLSSRKLAKLCFPAANR